MSSFHIERNNDAPPDRGPGRERLEIPTLTLLPTLGDGEHDRHDRHCGHKHIEHESDDGSLSNSKVVLASLEGNHAFQPMRTVGACAQSGKDRCRNGLCFAKILCALKIVRFPATMAASSRLSLHPRTPRICPGEPERYTCIYKDGGTRAFSRRYVGSNQAARSYRWCSPPSRT